uniref:Uncharacterized protein n=1 Tax=Panagrolaimus sp. ES5 TaxID=591445 RepID=A0AC34GDE6_9BILA
MAKTRSQNNSTKQPAPVIQKKKSQKQQKNESFDVQSVLKQHRNQINALERGANQNVALIWNLDVESKTEYFDSIDARFNAVYKFLDEVIGAENYSKTCVNYCNWFDKKKNAMEVNISSKIIDDIRRNQDVINAMKGINGQKIKFERKKTTAQRASDDVANEYRLRLIDYLYNLNNCGKSKTPNVFSSSGKVQVGKKGPKFTVQEIQNKYPLDLKKPLNECINCFDKNFEAPRVVPGVTEESNDEIDG